MALEKVFLYLSTPLLYAVSELLEMDCVSVIFVFSQSQHLAQCLAQIRWSLVCIKLNWKVITNVSLLCASVV